MKTTRHSLMAKGILVLLSLLVLVFAFTYSWYPDMSEPVSAYGMSITTDAGMDFDIAIGFKISDTRDVYTVSDFKDYSYEIDLGHIPVTIGDDAEPTYFDLLKDYSPLDMTGNGRHLFIPVLNNGTPRVISTAADGYTEVTPNKEYISFDMIFRATDPCQVYIDNGSFVLAGCETTPGDGHLTQRDSLNPGRLAYNNERKSENGLFSADAVVGAIRVAFIDYTSSMNLGNIFNDIADDSEGGVNYLENLPTLLWLPRPDVYLYSNNLSTTNWELITGIEPGQTGAISSDGVTPITFSDSTYVHKYYDLGIGGTKEIVTYTDTVTECNSDPIVDVNIPGTDSEEDEDDDPDYYYGKVRVNIWLEGTDAEARRAVAGGQFSVHFDLRAG